MELVKQESINKNIDISAFDLVGVNFIEVDFLKNYQLTIILRYLYFYLRKY